MLSARPRAFAALRGLATKADVVLLSRLRKETNLGVSRCKDALLATDNDYARALAWLAEKEQELAQQKATKVAGRTASEGLVTAAQLSPSAALLVEVNAETDYVARNEHFRRLLALVREAVVHAAPRLGTGLVYLEGDGLNQLVVPGTTRPVSEHVVQMIGLLGEKLSVRRAAVLQQPGSLVGHACLGGSGDEGRIGALVSLRTSATSPTRLQGLLTQLAQHVAGMAPRAVWPTDAPVSSLPPAEAAEAALMTQPFLFQQDITVRQRLQQAEAELQLAAGDLRVDTIVRFQRGEGLERATKDFATEVREQVAATQR